MTEETNTNANGGGLVLVNPQGSLEKSMQLVAFINARRDEVLAQIEAAENAIDETNYDSKETRDELSRLADIVEDLRDKGKKLVAEVCAATEAQRVLTAIDARLWSYSSKADPACAYAKIADAFKALKDRVAKIKADHTPPAPMHTYCVKLTATDKALAKIVKAAEKEGAVDVCWATAQSDAACDEIAAWFKANM
jgi:hypothetical protein